jgi:hypothetical protein
LRQTLRVSGFVQVLGRYRKMAVRSRGSEVTPSNTRALSALSATISLGVVRALADACGACAPLRGAVTSLKPCGTHTSSGYAFTITTSKRLSIGCPLRQTVVTGGFGSGPRHLLELDPLLSGLAR